MSYGDQFVKNDDASGKYNEMLSELFAGINSGSIRIPDMYRLESLELVAIRKKEYLAFLDTAQGCIRKIFSMRTANEICFGAPSFYDIVEDSRNGRSIAKYGSLSRWDFRRYHNTCVSERIFGLQHTQIICFFRKFDHMQYRIGQCRAKTGIVFICSIFLFEKREWTIRSAIERAADRFS